MRRMTIIKRFADSIGVTLTAEDFDLQKISEYHQRQKAQIAVFALEGGDQEKLDDEREFFDKVRNEIKISKFFEQSDFDQLKEL